MPAHEWLEEFGSMIWSAFGEPPYLVGSVLTGKKGEWRDVDVRLILSDEEWDKWNFGHPDNPNDKWRAHIMAFSELGKRITGLPIDFQIQQQSTANKKFAGIRSAIGLVPLRNSPPKPEN